MINGINQVDGELCIRSSDLNSYKNTFALSRIEKNMILLIGNMVPVYLNLLFSEYFLHRIFRSAVCKSECSLRMFL